MAEENETDEEQQVEGAVVEDAVVLQATQGGAVEPQGDADGAGAGQPESEEAAPEFEDAVEEDADEDEEKVAVDPVDLEFSADDIVDDDYEEEDEDEDVSPLEEFVDEEAVVEDGIEMEWYILKVQVNRENGVCDSLKREVARANMGHYFGDVLVPTEDVREFTKAGKQRISKRKLYPGYIVVNMAVNDDSWFLVRETSGIGDFAGASGRPKPLSQTEIDRILQAARPEEQEEEQIKTAIPFKVGERVRIKEGYFQNYEGDISNIDERNGRIEVMIDIFGRPNPVDMDHWHAEKVG